MELAPDIPGDRPASGSSTPHEPTSFEKKIGPRSVSASGFPIRVTDPEECVPGLLGAGPLTCADAVLYRPDEGGAGRIRGAKPRQIECRGAGVRVFGFDLVVQAGFSGTADRRADCWAL